MEEYSRVTVPIKCPPFCLEYLAGTATPGLSVDGMGLAPQPYEDRAYILGHYSLFCLKCLARAAIWPVCRQDGAAHPPNEDDTRVTVQDSILYFFGHGY